MYYLLICFACLFMYRLITNISAYIRISHYEKKYTLYLRNRNTVFSEHADAITQLFKAASVVDRLIPFTQPSGCGYVAQGNASLFQNLGNLREDVVGMTFRCFAEAKGTFKHRIIETFSPLFWINCVLFLPRTILEYLGVKGDSIFTKFFQLLYWIATPFLIAFRDNIYQFVISFIG